jgi:predicted nucleic acid-binding protein
MILVDTSVWIDHLHTTDNQLVSLLERSEVAQHPMVIGELALGTIRSRAEVLGLLAELQSTAVATHGELLAFVESNGLHGRGLSLVDAHLLAGVVLTPGARLWTRDKRLHSAASDLSVQHIFSTT